MIPQSFFLFAVYDIVTVTDGGGDSSHGGGGSSHGGGDSSHGGGDSSHGGGDSSHGGGHSSHGGGDSSHGGGDSSHGGVTESPSSQTTQSTSSLNPATPLTTQNNLETTVNHISGTAQTSLSTGPETTVDLLLETTQGNIDTAPGTTAIPLLGTTQDNINTGPGTTVNPISETTQTSVITALTDPVMTGSTGIIGSNPVPTNYASTTPGYTLIAGFSLNPITAQKFGESFLVGWTMTAGTNVTVTVAYNGIPCCNAGPFTNTGGQCDCLISDPNFFDPDGVVNVSVIASNLVSSTPAYIEVEVLKSITQVSFTMLTSYSDFGTGVEGRGSQRNIFPAEHPVQFNCSHTGRFIAHDLAVINYVLR